MNGLSSHLLPVITHVFPQGPILRISILLTSLVEFSSSDCTLLSCSLFSLYPPASYSNLYTGFKTVLFFFFFPSLPNKLFPFSTSPAFLSHFPPSSGRYRFQVEKGLVPFFFRTGVYLSFRCTNRLHTFYSSLSLKKTAY